MIHPTYRTPWASADPVASGEGQPRRVAPARPERFVNSLNESLSETEAAPDIPPYDPKIGPRISAAMYTEKMLTEAFDAQVLQNMKNPAGFIEARVESLVRATPAVVTSAAGGDPQRLNPAHLSTAGQAQAMLDHLKNLGVAVDEVTGSSFTEGPFSIDYGDDDRRPYQIGGMNVGALLLLYASYPKEVADQMVLDEWRRLSAA
jgi:hypothetical protein